MQFSGKITNSVLNHLAKLGWDRERLYEFTDIPLEFLRDPTSWIDAGTVESFLCAVETEFSSTAPDLNRDVGHTGAELRGWGVLDSVLRMMQKPQDIFTQPQRFISYFVSPAPPIVNLRTTEESVSFDLPIAHNEYPATVAYLSSALEGLPKFWGQECAHVYWRNTTVKISWSTAQSALLQEPIKNPRPELLESLVYGVEMAQAQVETRDLEIARLEQELRELRVQLSKAKPTLPETDDLHRGERAILEDKLFEVRENVLRLTDYLTRSQQALTMARTAHRQDPQVQAVLKRIDWDTIRSQYPWLHLQIMEGFNAIESLLNPKPAAPGKCRAGKVMIADVFNSLIERLQTSPTLQVHAQSFVAHPVTLDVERLHVVLWQILNAVARSLGQHGNIQMMARLDGTMVEISLLASGDHEQHSELPLLRGEKQHSDAALASAAELIHQQKGLLSIRDEAPGQRRIICHWPLVFTEEFSNESNPKNLSP